MQKSISTKKPSGNIQVLSNGVLICQLKGQFIGGMARRRDVQEEWCLAKDVVFVRNSVIFPNGGIYLESVVWKTQVVPNLNDNPQNIINEQIIEDIDLVIGMFWKSIGITTEN